MWGAKDSDIRVAYKDLQAYQLQSSVGREEKQEVLQYFVTSYESMKSSREWQEADTLLQQKKAEQAREEALRQLKKDFGDVVLGVLALPNKSEQIVLLQAFVDKNVSLSSASEWREANALLRKKQEEYKREEALRLQREAEDQAILAAKYANERFAEANGVVIDTKTGLMWAATDNGRGSKPTVEEAIDAGYAINWHEAKAYCESYLAGGYDDWRMPTLAELQELYDGSLSGYYPMRGKNLASIWPVKIDNSIQLSGYYIWSSDQRSSEAASLFFLNGGVYWNAQSGRYNRIRALPVRFRK